jgi:hypothetical protein
VGRNKTIHDNDALLVDKSREFVSQQLSDERLLRTNEQEAVIAGQIGASKRVQQQIDSFAAIHLARAADVPSPAWNPQLGARIEPVHPPARQRRVGHQAHPVGTMCPLATASMHKGKWVEPVQDRPRRAARELRRAFGANARAPVGLRVRGRAAQLECFRGGTGRQSMPREATRQSQGLRKPIGIRNIDPVRFRAADAFPKQGNKLQATPNSNRSRWSKPVVYVRALAKYRFFFAELRRGSGVVGQGHDDTAGQP